MGQPLHSMVLTFGIGTRDIKVFRLRTTFLPCSVSDPLPSRSEESMGKHNYQYIRGPLKRIMALK
jgi:hypothetical protein